MLQDNILVFIAILFVVLLLSIISKKIHVSYPIILVVGGLGISLIPNIPNISLHPDLVFLIFLPPLLYAAAWNTSWRNFWANKRPISMLAIGLVIFTSCGVAFISKSFIPGFTWAAGFLLGGIVSPPDAVAATSILQDIKAPKKVVTILEGESLVNDASSLIVFRFAVATILTGHFSLLDATGKFFIVAFGGIAIGLALAYFLYFVHKFLPTTASMDTAFTLISPYAMYILAEHFHCSGVLSVVSGGLFLSAHAHRVFTYQTRLQANSVWETIVFLFNGIVFILIGLQLPFVIENLDGYTINQAIGFGLMISFVAVLLRMLWVYPATYIPRWLSKKIRKNEPHPSLKTVFVVAWSGMRGVVSLASALAIPLTLTNGDAFPHRNIILFITFIVILFTLVVQGITLPVLIRRLQLPPDVDNGDEKTRLNHRLSKVIIDHLRNNYQEELDNNTYVQQLHMRYNRIAKDQEKNLEHEGDHEKHLGNLKRYRKILIELIDIRRNELAAIRCERAFDDDLIRHRETEIDFEEARLKSL